MNDATNNATDPPAKSRRNWWKVAFFVSLFALELAREIAVLAVAAGASPNASAIVFSLGGYVKAQGSWKRIDGGGPLMPTTVTIECRRETGKCVEASTSIHDEYVYAPELDWFDATFSQDAVSYVNDFPVCARYSVRLDLKMQKVFAVRERKKNPTNPNCTNLEQRIEMQLADGHESKRNTSEGHFVPIFSAIAALAEIA